MPFDLICMPFELVYPSSIWSVRLRFGVLWTDWRRTAGAATGHSLAGYLKAAKKKLTQEPRANCLLSAGNRNTTPHVLVMLATCSHTQDTRAFVGPAAWQGQSQQTTTKASTMPTSRMALPRGKKNAQVTNKRYRIFGSIFVAPASLNGPVGSRSTRPPDTRHSKESWYPISWSESRPTGTY